jgi:hypothetical protein
MCPSGGGLLVDSYVLFRKGLVVGSYVPIYLGVGGWQLRALLVLGGGWHFCAFQEGGCW